MKLQQVGQSAHAQQSEYKFYCFVFLFDTFIFKLKQKFFQFKHSWFVLGLLGVNDMNRKVYIFTAARVESGQASTFLLFTVLMLS